MLASPSRDLARRSACALLLCAACSEASPAPGLRDDAGTTYVNEGGVVDLSVPGDPGYGRQDASVQDAAYVRPLPENVSFETATRIAPDEPPPLQDERYGDQVDYFVFTAKAGVFYEISTDSHRFSPDNVLAVYDDERVLLAENDDGARWRGDAIDARVIVRAERDGDIFLKVEDPYTDPDFFVSSNFQLLYYHPRVLEIGADTPGYSLESAGAPVTFELDAETDYYFVTLIGETGSGDDTFSFHGFDQRVLAARVLQQGADTPQSGGAWASALVRDSSAHVIGQIENALEQQGLHPPVDDEDYELHVQTNDEALDSTSFYAIDVVLVPDNPREADDLQNNTTTGADAVLFVGTLPRRGLLLSTLPSGDIDHYRIELADEERVAVTCEASSGGSRLQTLVAEIIDGDGNVLATAGETPDGLFLDPVGPEAAGTYYLRLTSSTAALDTPEAAWVRCAVRVGF